jgi:tripartite-type tricarboxylate transporter receptor subunit TctC
VLEPETRKNMLAQGMDSVGNTQAEFTAIYNSEIARWAKVVKSLGLQAN